MYHQAFGGIPYQWLDHVLGRRHHSHLFGKYIERRQQRDPDGATPEEFRRWEHKLTAHSLGCVKRIADTEIYTSLDEATLEADRISRSQEGQYKVGLERPVPNPSTKDEEEASSGLPEYSVDFGGDTEAESQHEGPCQ